MEVLRLSHCDSFSQVYQIQLLLGVCGTLDQIYLQDSSGGGQTYHQINLQILLTRPCFDLKILTEILHKVQVF
jgi:hypothetical protein